MAIRKGSPWIAQLERERQARSLEGDEVTDTLLVGGGISGLATAFFVLRDTDRSVILLERDLVAHGATGHNAGQAVVAMERPFRDLVSAMGESQVAQGYREMSSGSEHLDEILSWLGRRDLLLPVEARVAISSPQAAMSLLGERGRWSIDGAPPAAMAAVRGTLPQPPEEVKEVSSDRLLEILRVIDRSYMAALCTASAVLNTAALAEAMAERLLAAYPERFRLFESSEVRRLRIGDEVAATAAGGTVIADNAVLCTNGYTGIEMQSCETPVVVGNVKSVVGFMAGRFMAGPPGTEAFFRDDGATYYYLTRRPYAGRSLVCIGGPEKKLAAGEGYDPEKAYEPGAFERIDAFARQTLEGYTERDMEWHGLMGYTPGGARLVGADPGVPSLMYNLGCNGIGLLASIAGGWKVAQMMRGAIFPPSMFDPARLARNGVIRIV